LRRITIVGTGYVGLVTGTCLADLGNQVTCVDIDESKIALLKNEKIPFFEPGLKELVQNNVTKGRLNFSTDVAKSIIEAEIIFIAVGTPSAPGGEVDLKYVETVSKTIGENLNDFKIIVNKSTVSVGTGRKIAEIIQENSKADQEFEVVSNPEFLREGSAINDFMRPDRIVLGSDSEKAFDIMSEIYRPLFLIETPIIKTSIETAELIKYASNAFLSVKISFINEVANLCDKTGADVHIVAKAMGLDGRISPKFLHAGPGFGGSCFPKDTLGLAHLAKDHGVDSLIAEAAMIVNVNQKQIMVNKLKSLLPELDGKKVAILGLAFKPNTDDVRESPSLKIIEILLEEGCIIRAYDPIALENSKKIMPDIAYFEDMMDACEGADAVMLMTEWNELRQMDLEQLKDKMAIPNVVDCRNIYDPESMKESGFNYISVGRTIGGNA